MGVRFLTPLIVLTGLWLSVAPVFALSVPEKPTGYVNDAAGLLSAASRARLEEQLALFERETSNQIVIATFPSLEGDSLEDFSMRLAEKWKVGSEKKDNGVILLIFRDDRQVRIEVGYGLEGALPDVTASRIIRNELVPAFRAGDTNGGVEKAVLAIMAAVKGEYQGVAEPVDKIQPYAPHLFGFLVLYLLIPLIAYLAITGFCLFLFGFPLGLGVALAVIAVLEALRRVLSSSLVGRTYSGHGHFGGYGGGGFSGGGFGGGGFGGGGGGGFGGGGASGRW